MNECDISNNLLLENDKRNAPFLLAACFQDLIEFKGVRVKEGVLHWEFFPEDKARLLIQQFQTKTEPRIPAKDIFEAIELWWKQIADLRNKKTL